MKILITGSHGFIGSALHKHFTSTGHEVMPLVRTPVASPHILWDINANQLDRDKLDDFAADAVVHLAGEGVANRRWTVQQKQKIRDSRVKGTELLVSSLGSIDNKPSIFLSGSAIGYYGDGGDEKLNETAPPGKNFLSEVCQQWEAAAQPLSKAGIPVALLRTGHVLDKSGGMLKKMMLPFKLGIGGRFGNGRQYVNWISLEDHIRAMVYIIENKLEGPYNLVGPEPVTNREFTRALASQYHRPAILPTPLFPLRLIYGKELVDDVLLASQRVIPTALREAGFTFTHNTLITALNDVA